MKKFASEFFCRGLSACGLGPVILAIIYLVMHQTAAVEALTVNQVCTGIFSLTFLAFIAGGMNSIYRIEQLPLMLAILIHGVVLYISYLVTYLLNNWLEWDWLPVLVFSCIFVVGYIIIWAIIYSVIRKNTQKVNRMLKEKQKNMKDKA